MIHDHAARSSETNGDGALWNTDPLLANETKNTTHTGELKMTYWNNQGTYQEKADFLQGLCPASGAATDPVIEAFRVTASLYYDFYNNGWDDGSCNPHILAAFIKNERVAEIVEEMLLTSAKAAYRAIKQAVDDPTEFSQLMMIGFAENLESLTSELVKRLYEEVAV
jgi:hypothetical protein